MLAWLSLFWHPPLWPCQGNPWTSNPGTWTVQTFKVVPLGRLGAGIHGCQAQPSPFFCLWPPRSHSVFCKLTERWFWAQNVDNVSKIHCTTCISVPINKISSENSKLGSRMPATLIAHFLVAVKWLRRFDSTKASSQSMYRLNTSRLAGQP